MDYGLVWVGEQAGSSDVYLNISADPGDPSSAGYGDDDVTYPTSEYKLSTVTAHNCMFMKSCL